MEVFSIFLIENSELSYLETYIGSPFPRKSNEIGSNSIKLWEMGRLCLISFIRSGSDKQKLLCLGRVKTKFLNLRFFYLFYS